MLQNLLLKTLRDQRIPILAYGLGLGALALLIIAIYPSFAASGTELEGTRWTKSPKTATCSNSSSVGVP